MTLRIQRAVRGALPILSLSGRLQLEQLPGLRRLLDDEPDQRPFALDLRNLTLVDYSHDILLLLQRHARACRFRARYF